MRRKLVIVGAGMAAAYVLQELAQLEHDLDVTVIGDETEACYNRVLLSNVLAGENSEADLAMLEPAMLEPAMPETDSPETDSPGTVQFVTGTRVSAIDTDARTARCADGSEHPFDALVFATGAGVARPGVDCSGIIGVEVFRTLRDARELRALPARGRRALVVGAGLLGLEAAHGLNELGFDTRVLHRNPVIMNRQLDTEGGAQLQRDLEARGIHFDLGVQIAGVAADDNGRLCGVTLDNGERLPADLLLFATGITPNIELAAQAGIATARGIRVDERLRTSAPGVYALGECSQFGEHCFGLVAPIREQAAVLAAQLAGVQHPPFCLQDYPTQLKISGVEIYRAGELDDAAEQLVLRGNGVYRRLVLRDNRLVGAVLVGDKRGGTWYSELISGGGEIGALRAGLIFGRDVSEALAAA
ncbi:NAD(P)/FAD-dependent oxidoreductase [Mangrovimicrobium sediminis]|nr:FAD-dependent oxidoreductase [Haliea sp. SAOS-164]